MNLIRKSVFYLLLATIPIQLGKHFWPNEAFINGIRIDYLSPTLYISDILFFVLFLLSFRQILNIIRKSKLFWFTIFVILSGNFMSTNLLQAFHGTLKFLEFVYIGFYCREFLSKKDIPNIIFIFAIGGMVESLILFFQFISQGSIGGLFYFLGERTFSASTPGIALFRYGQDLLLRPYGTFPHPNVASFYLLTGFSLILFGLKFKKTIIDALKILALLVISIGILITFSRVTIVLVFFVILLRLLTLGKTITKKKIFSIFWGVVFVGGLVFVVLFDRFENQILRDISLRIELINISVSIFLQNPFFGVGLNNFFFHEASFQKTVSPILFQPVHNIYIYWIVQTGIIGAVSMFWLIIKLIKKINISLNSQKVKKSFYLSILVIVVCGFIIGFFDHYLVTLQQGQLISTVLLGMLFSKGFRSVKA